MSQLTITQPSMIGNSQTEYTMDEYVSLFTWHSGQLFKVLDSDDPNFGKDWEEMMEYDKKIKTLAMQRFVSIYAKQNK